MNNTFKLSAVASRCDRILRESNPKIPSYNFRGRNTKLPSATSNSIGNAVVSESPKYSGNNMIGVAQMHKSNAVPVFSQEEAVNISKMRR